MAPQIDFLDPVPSDITISQSIVPLSIDKIAAAIGVLDTECDLYGRNKAKISLAVRDRLKDR